MRPAAVVVGLCSHGLAVVRALARSGVDVHALEAKRFLPGTRTRHARVHFVEDINRGGLVPALLEVAERIGGRPVLFLTNDNMVREAAAAWAELEPRYRLSWGVSAKAVAALLSKADLHAHCRRVGAAYPRSVTLESREAVASLDADLRFPLVVKPARPLSPFKVRRIAAAADLGRLVEAYPAALPFVVQEWIPGDDRALRFCALYLDRGRVLARFEGRKLRSSPPALGATTAAEAYRDDAVYEETLKFFRDLQLSGPVSLEVKLGPDGTPWVIEPTLGRTDFWLGCCIGNGVNLPLVEYLHQAGEPVPDPGDGRPAVWVDTERDPAAVWTGLRAWALQRRSVVLPYLAADDPRPSLVAWRQFLWATLRRIARLPRRLLRR